MFFVVCLLFLRAHHNTCLMRTRPRKIVREGGREKGRGRTASEIKPMCNKHEEWFVLNKIAYNNSKIMSSIFLSAFHEQNRSGIRPLLQFSQLENATISSDMKFHIFYALALSLSLTLYVCMCFVLKKKCWGKKGCFLQYPNQNPAAIQSNTNRLALHMESSHWKIILF